MSTNISTITLAQTAEWAKRMSFGRTFNLSTTQEPALTSANIVLQTMLGPPFAWIWNMQNVQFTCVATTQDYTQNVPSFAWIDWASVQDIGVTPNKWYELQINGNIGLDTVPGRPRFITPNTQDVSTGDVTFRVIPVPDKAYPVSMNVAKAPPLFTSMNQTWSPIPDRFSYIYSWGFLALMWMFADDPRWTMANQKFIAALLGASEGLTETQQNIFLANWDLLTGQKLREQQGTQARGV